MQYIDDNGDLANVTATKGTFDFAKNFIFTPSGIGETLFLLDLTPSHGDFAGESITVSVKKMPGGDGLTPVTAINADGVNLGAVKIAGDLENIFVGTGDDKIPAIKSLTVNSFGLHQAFAGVDNSTNNGALGSFTANDRFQDSDLQVKNAGIAVEGNRRRDIVVRMPEKPARRR